MAQAKQGQTVSGILEMMPSSPEIPSKCNPAFLMPFKVTW